MKEIKLFVPMLFLALLLIFGCYKALQTGVKVPVVNVSSENAKELQVGLENKNVNDQLVRTYSNILTFKQQNLPYLSYKLAGDTKEAIQTAFPRTYTEVDGVLTFRGNHLRDRPSFGHIPSQASQLSKVWEFTTKRSPDWGGGAGWTGQPAIIKWGNDVLQMMNVYDEFKKNPGFVEVVYGSLDGHIYFFDLHSGKPSRPSINMGNAIRGSVSLDPRGYPLLYVGQGVPQTSKTDIGLRIFSLIDGKQLAMIKGIDPFAYRRWGAFGGSPLINRKTDTMVVGGENGLLYHIKLHTRFFRDKKVITVNPFVMKYRYHVKGNLDYGIENSPAAYKNVTWFADNGGSIQAVDMMTNRPIWALSKTDDTDATIVVDEENGNTPYLYTGTEVDKQGNKGIARLRKLNGLTGKEIWSTAYPALTVKGKNPVNGGLLATPVNGKRTIKDLIIYTVARAPSLETGLMVALDKQTGKEVWRWRMPKYTWSSPVDIYDEKGKAYILQADANGSLYMLSGKDGKIVSKIELGHNVEASPAVYDDMLVVATRAQKIYGVKISGTP
ncbi:PQQ-binding-like beta-propeller repeat protein [Bacillus songklensis]|uniref:PQQ-binding-like beta-propeller repeat protein n=1 Tax=Bacillus songklensis TaxID=1069116 RepID=A0ABV8B0A0_9BACI